MLRQIRPAFVLIVLMTLLTGLAYPLFITGIAQLLCPRQAAGSLIAKDGNVIGSALIGHKLAAAKGCHARPSATSATESHSGARWRQIAAGTVQAAGAS